MTTQKRPRNIIYNCILISVPCVVPKVFHKVVYSFYYKRVYNRISLHQYGFIKVMQMLCIFSSFLEVSGSIVERPSQVDTIYLDFQNVFNKLFHHVLLKTSLSLDFPCKKFNFGLVCLSSENFFSSGVPQYFN